MLNAWKSTYFLIAGMQNFPKRLLSISYSFNLIDPLFSFALSSPTSLLPERRELSIFMLFPEAVTKPLNSGRLLRHIFALADLTLILLLSSLKNKSAFRFPDLIFNELEVRLP